MGDHFCQQFHEGVVMSIRPRICFSQLRSIMQLTRVRTFIVAAVLGLSSVLPITANAAPITITGIDSTGRAATATFAVSGSNLLVTLTNTATYDALVPVDILTAVFFDLDGIASLTPVTALLSPGAAVVHGPTPATQAGGSVGSEFAFRDDLVGAPGDAQFGLSSSGLGLFGPGDRFVTNFNLQGPDSPNGIQYGITTAGDDPSTGNAGIADGLIKNSVTFTLLGLPANFDPSASVHNVSFQYGTSLSEPRTVPEPATLALLLGGAAVGAVSRRRRRAPRV
jgi:PEP-CTERM motif-containing protein